MTSRILACLAGLTLLALAGCDEGYSSELPLHNARDAVNFTQTYDDLSPGSAPNCGRDLSDENAPVEHCLFRFGDPVRTLATANATAEDLEGLRNVLTPVMADWIIVRTESLGVEANARFHYAAIRRSALAAAETFAQARFAALSASIDAVPLSLVIGGLTAGTIEWRVPPGEDGQPSSTRWLIFHARQALEAMLIEDVLELRNIVELPTVEERCAASKYSRLRFDYSAMFGCAG